MQVSKRPVKIIRSPEDKAPGQVEVHEWTKKQAFVRGFKKSAKICLIACGVILPFAVLEPFLFMLWGSLALFGVILLLGPLLHIKYGGERQTFSYVEGTCPHCGKSTQLKPYLNSEFLPQFTVICPECGQTCQVESDQVAPSS